MRLVRWLVVVLLTYSVVLYAATQEHDTKVADQVQTTPSTTPVQPQAVSPTEVDQAQRALLEQRVVAKWDALIKKDFEAAYSFTSPAYRKLYTLNSFKSKFGNKAAWKRIEVIGVDFKGDNAAIVGIILHFVYYTTQMDKPLDMKTHIQESWVREDGQWWYLMKE